MGFGNKKAAPQVGIDRLAAVAGGGAAAATAAPAAAGAASEPVKRVSVEPDVSRIRKRQIEETPEDRKKRLAAKAVNFSATILARIAILAAAGLYMWKEYEFTGKVHRGVALGAFAMTADLGRVILKAMEPGSK